MSILFSKNSILFFSSILFGHNNAINCLFDYRSRVKKDYFADIASFVSCTVYSRYLEFQGTGQTMSSYQ